MKVYKILLFSLFLLSVGLVNAQCLRVINAECHTILGGREGTNGNRFQIIVKNNPNIKVEYLMIGANKIALEQYEKGDQLELRGYYFAKQNFPTVEKEHLANKDLNLKKAFVFYSNKHSQKLKKKRIKMFKDIPNVGVRPQ